MNLELAIQQNTEALQALLACLQNISFAPAAPQQSLTIQEAAIIAAVAPTVKAEPKAQSVSLDDLKKAFIPLAQSNPVRARNILQSFGLNRLTEAAEDKYTAILDELRKVEA